MNCGADPHRRSLGEERRQRLDGEINRRQQAGGARKGVGDEPWPSTWVDCEAGERPTRRPRGGIGCGDNNATGAASAAGEVLTPSSARWSAASSRLASM
jgi:hypothetical protein